MNTVFCRPLADEKRQQRQAERKHGKQRPDRVEPVPFTFVGKPRVFQLAGAKLLQVDGVQRIVERHVSESGHAKSANEVGERCQQHQPKGGVYGFAVVQVAAQDEEDQAPEKAHEEFRVKDRPVDLLHGFEVTRAGNLAGAG